MASSLMEIADRLHSTAIRLLRGVRKQDEATGLSGARLSALSVLVFGGPQTVTGLASAEQVTAPTMTRMLAGMSRDGLVKRERDAADKRVIRVRATARGVRILQEGRRRRVEALADQLRGLTEADLDLLDRAIVILQR